MCKRGSVGGTEYKTVDISDMWIPFRSNNPLVSPPLPVLSDRQEGDLLSPPHRGPGPTHWEFYHCSEKGQGPKVGKYSLTPSFASFFSQLHTGFPQDSTDSSATALMDEKTDISFSSVLRLKTVLPF